jgi:hypothetical protein
LVQLCGPLPALGQQQRVDPNFDARVADPAMKGKAPAVVIDEAHDNFHTAGGGYKPFADLLAGDGYRVVPGKEKFSAKSLKGAEVLVVVNAMGPRGRRASPAFTEAECDTVRDWVKSGGRLLLIADHFPMGSAAEPLGKRFGVEMSKGMTDDPVNHDKELKDIQFTRQSGRLGSHPILEGRNPAERINRVVTFTGQSLKGPPGSTPFLLLADTAYDEVPPDRKKVSAAGRCQGVALTFGKGRVVVLGEAGMLTAQLDGENRFGMNVPGLDNKQLALNVMHWLSGLLD